MTEVIITLITGLPAIIAAIAALKGNKKTRQVQKEVASPNGMKTGDLVYKTYEELQKHTADLKAHHQHKGDSLTAKEKTGG